MAGGEGSLSRGTAKSAAAATGAQGPLKRYPAKRKAKKEAPAAGPHASSKGSSTKRKAAAKDPASCRMPPLRLTRRKPKDLVVVEEEEEAPGEQKYRQLSKADVDWILALKPMKPPARFAALKRSNPELTPQPGEEADEDKRRLYRLAKAFFDMEEGLPKTQEWVRSELDKKGFVRLDRESAKRRAEVQAVIDREWPAIEEKMKSLILSEKECHGEKQCQGGDETDSDEGEEDVSDSDESEEEEDGKVK